jgi:hypothetical protein
MDTAFTLAPAADAGSGAPGDALVYSLTVENTGNLTDTYTVTVGGHAWPLAFPGTAGSLAPGASASIVLTTTIPLSATDGETDVVNVTVTSQADPALSAGAVLTSTALVPLRFLYLPLILRLP